MIEDRLVNVVESGVEASRRRAASLGCSKILLEEESYARMTIWRRPSNMRFGVSVELPKRELTKQM